MENYKDLILNLSEFEKRKYLNRLIFLNVFAKSSGDKIFLSAARPGLTLVTK